MTDKAKVLDALTEIVPQVLREEFPERADLCVLGTRIGYDACRYFEIDAKPCCVRTIAFNQDWYEHYVATGCDLDHPSWESFMGENGNAWSVVVDESERDEPGRYAGHLVLLAEPDDLYLLDLTMRQFARPERGMLFPDAYKTRLDRDAFARGEPIMLSEPPGYLLYRLRTDAPDYRRGGDWRVKQPLSGQVIRRLKATL